MGRKITGGISVEVDAKTSRFNRGMGAAEKSLDSFGKKSKLTFASVKQQAKSFDRQFDKLTKRFLGFAKVFGTIAVAGGVAGLISVNREVERLTASLETVTGSQKNAQKAFDMIEQFTATTPFQINQVAEAFIKLKSLGLTPSEAALRSYGNTASAMGKSLDQMIEAVADATTGEFERLKSFGIRASSEGDNVSLTFQGVTTKIGKNTLEIEQYLRRIGDVEFASAMDKQMTTLDGVISNMKDSFFALAVTIGQAGFADAVREITVEIGKFTKNVKAHVEDPSSMPQWLKITTFAAKAAVAEFRDLGNWMGAVMAIAVKASTFDIEGVKAIIAAREQTRVDVEQSLENYVAMLEGIETRISNIKNNAGQGDETEEGDEDKAPKAFGVMSDADFETEFDRAEEQQNKLNKLYDKKAKEQLKMERSLSSQLVSIKMNVAQQAIGFFKLIAGESKGAALVALAAEKALAIASTIVNTEAAVWQMKATAPWPAWPAAEATIRGMGKLSIGLIAATGLAQAGGIGGGGGDSGVGGVPVSDTAGSAPSSPPTVFDDTGGGSTAPGIVYINVESGIRDEGNIIELVEAINELAGDGLEVRATVIA